MCIKTIQLYPEWFPDLIEEWSVEYSGKAVNLSAKSCTQIIWPRKGGRRFLFQDNERIGANDSFRMLESEGHDAARLLRFFYLSGRPKSIRDIEVEYKMSNRAAYSALDAARACMYLNYVGFKKAA